MATSDLPQDVRQNVTYDEEQDQVPRFPDIIGMVRDECQSIIDSYTENTDGTIYKKTSLILKIKSNHFVFR